MTKYLTPILFTVALGIFGLRVINAVNRQAHIPKEGSLYTAQMGKHFFVLVNQKGEVLFEDDIAKNMSLIRGSLTASAVGLDKQLAATVGQMRISRDSGLEGFLGLHKPLLYITLRNCPMPTKAGARIKVGSVRCYFTDPMGR
jgi:hypothetical protein